MSILDKVKIGNSVQVNLDLSKDRLTKETIDAINVSSLGKINDFRITDGKGIGVILQLSNGKEQWCFEDEIDLLDENGNVIKKNNDKKENTIIFQQECPKFVSEIEKEKLNLDKLNSLSDLYLRPLINKNIEELILGCSHYPLIYDFLRKKLDSNIKIIDPSVVLINKFNESFAIPKTDRYESISLGNVKFFVTSKRDEFSNKVKFWLGINKEIRLVNLRSNV